MDQATVAVALATERLQAGPPTQLPFSKPPAYQDARRARELYRYFRPDDLAFEGARRGSSPKGYRAPKQDGPESPNIALTAYSQLAALRCHAQRAMVR